MTDLLIRRESATSWTLRLLLSDEPVALGEVHLAGDRYTAMLTDGTPVEDVNEAVAGFDSLRHAAEGLARAFAERAPDGSRVGIPLGAVVEEEPEPAAG